MTPCDFYAHSKSERRTKDMSRSFRGQIKDAYESGDFEEMEQLMDEVEQLAFGDGL